MTGLDRLRELADGMVYHSVWSCTDGGYRKRHGLSLANDGGPLGAILADIADRIEAEQDERVTRRLEDREAAEWVREHGGLDSVKKLLDWVVGHCSTKQQLDFDFWLSGRVMHELGFEEDMADRDEVERRLLARLMPEGMEWLIEAWPKLEDDAPVKLGDMALIDGDVDMVEAVQIWIHGKPVIYGDNGSQQLEKGERVKRPAPKVLDADGVEIRAGEMVYHIETGDEFTVIAVDAESGDVHVRWGYDFEDKTGTIGGSYLTHRVPVLAADGKPLEAGQVVYHIESGDEFTVTGVDAKSGDANLRWGYDFEEKTGSCAAELLTHQRPVPASDGLPLREGEHVYHVETGAELVVKGLPKPGEYQAVVVFALPTSPASHLTSFDPDQLTHERPDTWQRIEEDIFDGFMETEETARDLREEARDIVRRAKKLAGVDND